MRRSTLRLILALLVAAPVVACSPKEPVPQPKAPTPQAPLYDQDRYDRAPVVLRVKLVRPGIGSKFLWDEVEVLAVMKNDSPYEFRTELRVAHYSWEPGIPSGVSTVYLVPYADRPTNQWKLVDGKASSGVSHTAK